MSQAKLREGGWPEILHSKRERGPTFPKKSTVQSKKEQQLYFIMKEEIELLPSSLLV